MHLIEPAEKQIRQEMSGWHSAFSNIRFEVRGHGAPAGAVFSPELHSIENNEVPFGQRAEYLGVETQMRKAVPNAFKRQPPRLLPRRSDLASLRFTR